MVSGHYIRCPFLAILLIVTMVPIMAILGLTWPWVFPGVCSTIGDTRRLCQRSNHRRSPPHHHHQNHQHHKRGVWGGGTVSPTCWRKFSQNGQNIKNSIWHLPWKYLTNFGYPTSVGASHPQINDYILSQNFLDWKCARLASDLSILQISFLSRLSPITYILHTYYDLIIQNICQSIKHGKSMRMARPLYTFLGWSKPRPWHHRRKKTAKYFHIFML